MKYLELLLNLLKKIFYDSGEYTIYSLSQNDRESDYFDSDIKIFSRYSDIPYFIKKELLKYPLINPFYYRLKLRQTTLLIINDDSEIISYGWVQSWGQFKRKFGWLYPHAVMLGPYWTNILYRGRGYYGRLLNQSITLAGNDCPLFIYTSPENISSQKGIEKIGFNKIGIFKITLILRYFRWYEQIDKK